MRKISQKRKSKFSQEEGGFTLLELIVATGIFLTISTLALGIYTQSLKSQRKSLVKIQIQRESQLIMETITKKIRTSVVDYSQYTPGFLNPQTTLHLVDSTGATIAFRQGTGDVLEVSFDGGSVYRSFSAQSIRITSLDFFIEPTTDPFVNPGERPSAQPRVTISTVFASADALTPSSILVEQLVPQRSSGF